MLSIKVSNWGRAQVTGCMLIKSLVMLASHQEFGSDFKFDFNLSPQLFWIYLQLTFLILSPCCWTECSKIPVWSCDPPAQTFWGNLHSWQFLCRHMVICNFTLSTSLIISSACQDAGRSKNHWGEEDVVYCMHYIAINTCESVIYFLGGAKMFLNPQ